MARIKCVLNERRLAYKQAVEIYDAQQLGVTVKDSTATSLAAPPASSIDSMFEEVRETEKVEGSVTQRV